MLAKFTFSLMLRIWLCVVPHPEEPKPVIKSRYGSVDKSRRSKSGRALIIITPKQFNVDVKGRKRRQNLLGEGNVANSPSNQVVPSHHRFSDVVKMSLSPLAPPPPSSSCTTIYLIQLTQHTKFRGLLPRLLPLPITS